MTVRQVLVWRNGSGDGSGGAWSQPFETLESHLSPR
jgi:hypothetical protein